eukprot:jgi/Mesen1/9075/ME000578S08314
MTDTQAPSNAGSETDVRSWLERNKLKAVGGLWASGIAASLAYNMRKPGEKFSVKLIHARLHAQAFTLAALLGAAGVEYWEHRSGDKAKRYASHIVN